MKIALFCSGYSSSSNNLFTYYFCIRKNVTVLISRVLFCTLYKPNQPDVELQLALLLLRTCIYIYVFVLMMYLQTNKVYKDLEKSPNAHSSLQIWKLLK